MRNVICMTKKELTEIYGIVEDEAADTGDFDGISDIIIHEKLQDD